MSHSYIFPILRYHVYTPTKIGNILNMLLTAILPHIYILSLCSIMTCAVYTHTDFEIY